MDTHTHAYIIIYREIERETCSNRRERVSFDIFKEDDIKEYTVRTLYPSSESLVSLHMIYKQGRSSSKGDARSMIETHIYF